MPDNMKKILAVIIGELLCAFAISYFFVPHKLLSGGFGGIGIMIQYLTGYSSGIFIFLLNIPVFIIGFHKLSKDFMFFTFISANLLSLYLLLFNHLDLSFQVDDILLSAVFGGLINGVGMGILFRYATSQGGLDILAIIAKKEWNLNVSSGLMAMNGVVITIASILFGLEKGLYTLIAMYIAYHFMDKVLNGFDNKKQLIIVSEKSHEIGQRIMVDPHRGVTYFHASGAYTGKEKDVIYVVAGNRQVVRIKQVVSEIDPNAFISISNMVEVKGRGFKHREVQ